jgi:hypothetical protein
MLAVGAGERAPRIFHIGSELLECGINTEAVTMQGTSDGGAARAQRVSLVPATPAQAG